MTETTDQSGDAPLLKNRYKLGRVLGRGGMCIVYQAWDTRLQRNVAVKRLDPSLSGDPRNRARFDREGRALAQLSHPNLVTLIDRGSTDKEEYLVFDYVEGRSLKDIVREGPMPVDEMGKIAGQVVEGLSAAHLRGIVHRDVKPQNILIDHQGHAKVTDFGIATGQDWTRLTREGSVIGSARYMSPEQIQSRAVDSRSDIYSLGAVMYEMLAGQPPFDGASMPEVARQHLNNQPRPLSELRQDLPAGLEKVVMKCLEKVPDDRFSSMDEVLGALVGLGLYTPHRARDVSHGHRRLHKKTDEPLAEALEPPETDSESRQRLRSRALVRQRKANQRIKWGIIGGAILIVLIVVIVLVTALGGAKAPSVVGLTIEQAKTEAAKQSIDVTVNDIPSFDKKDGTVLAQSPLADQGLKDNKLTLSVARTPVQIKVTKVAAVDPQGDARENNKLLPNLIDGKTATSWTTEYYRSSSFGGLKSGVGVDFTLKEAATLIVVMSPIEGWSGQVLPIISGKPGTSVAALTGKSSQTILLKQSVTGVRLWFTKLSKLTDTRWGVDLSEVRFYK